MKFIPTITAFIFTLSLACTVSAQKTVPSINIKTLEGKTVNIQDYTSQGKITVLSFWATWCSPCKKELNTIADMYSDWQEKYDMQLIAITIDNSRALRKVKPMVDNFGWDYVVLSDEKEELKKALNFQTVPQTFLIDQEGNIVYAHSGYTPGDEYELEEKIKALAAPTTTEEVEKPKKEKKKKKSKKEKKEK